VAEIIHFRCDSQSFGKAGGGSVTHVTQGRWHGNRTESHGHLRPCHRASMKCVRKKLLGFGRLHGRSFWRCNCWHRVSSGLPSHHCQGGLEQRCCLLKVRSHQGITIWFYRTCTLQGIFLFPFNSCEKLKRKEICIDQRLILQRKRLRKIIWLTWVSKLNYSDLKWSALWTPLKLELLCWRSTSICAAKD
jgi:hypothetical protein